VGEEECSLFAIFFFGLPIGGVRCAMNRFFGSGQHTQLPRAVAFHSPEHTPIHIHVINERGEYRYYSAALSLAFATRVPILLGGGVFRVCSQNTLLPADATLSLPSPHTPHPRAKVETKSGFFRSVFLHFFSLAQKRRDRGRRERAVRRRSRATSVYRLTTPARRRRKGYRNQQRFPRFVFVL